MTKITKTEVYSQPCGPDRIAIIRVDEAIPYGAFDFSHINTYDVVLGHTVLTLGGCFDNIREARAFLDGYIAAEKVTRAKWLASVERNLADLGPYLGAELNLH
jgi:hypothetical protein